MTEIQYTKLKDGTWMAKDRQGNKAFGITKQLAANDYFMRYEMNLNNNNIDLSKYIGGSNGIL